MENQERAYIAASRRSDRSLEARIVSAQRASEKHQERTGKALRVREEDVINEDMYEEIHDESQLFSRISANINEANLGFQHRLQAYLRTHVGMRHAIAGQALLDRNSVDLGFAQQQGNFAINPAMYANQAGNAGIAFPNGPAPQYHQNQGPQTQQQQQIADMVHMQKHMQLQMQQRLQHGEQSFHNNQGMVHRPATYSQERSCASHGSHSSHVESSPYQQVADMESRNDSLLGPASDAASPRDQRTHSRTPSFPIGSFNRMQNVDVPASRITSENRVAAHNRFSAQGMNGQMGMTMPLSFSTQLPAETQGFLGSNFDVVNADASTLFTSNSPSWMNNIQQPNTEMLIKQERPSGNTGLHSTLTRAASQFGVESHIPFKAENREPDNEAIFDTFSDFDGGADFEDPQDSIFWGSGPDSNLFDFEGYAGFTVDDGSA